MLKKPLLFCLLCVSAATSAMFCTSPFAMTTLSIPQNSQDKAMPEDGSAASASAQMQTQLDRSGVDRASVHLQILQQSTSHFSDTNPAKKASVYDKKAQLKAGSNS